MTDIKPITVQEVRLALAELEVQAKDPTYGDASILIEDHIGILERTLVTLKVVEEIAGQGCQLVYQDNGGRDFYCMAGRGMSGYCAPCLAARALGKDQAEVKKG